jgi:predicted acylesterase/phospholipase RssA
MGLSLSGGGFRAAAFHLGVLDLLHRLDLLRRVRVLSTVSGGSFVGAAYALAVARDEPFPCCFERCRAFLCANHLPRRTVEVFRRRAPQTPSPTRTLIKAAAEVYDETLFEGARFGELLAASSHLPEVIVNATEFRTGVAFRFRASASPLVRIGNGNVSIPRDAAARLRLADVVAASSCFPGGFEPLILPGDFNWSADRPDALPDELADLEPVALMDGGISDNQGVDSVRLADRGHGVDFDMVIISDTDRALVELYPPPPAWPSSGPRLRHLALLATAATVLLATVSVHLLGRGIATLATGELRPLEDLLGLWVPGLACGAMALLPLIALGVGLSAARRILPAGLRRRFVAAVGDLALGEALELVKIRAASLVALTSHVFTRRIRRQVFDAAFDEEGARERLVPSLIARLVSDRCPAPQPSPPLLGVAERAGRMPTTLWFEHPGQCDELIACGQATLCHALLDHLRDRDDADELRGRVEELWQRLCEDPLCLIDAFARVPGTEDSRNG